MSSPDIARVIKSMRIWWVVHVECAGVMGNAGEGKLFWKWRRGRDTMKMNFMN